MIKPKPLKEGDRVAFISPSSPILEERLNNAISYFEGLGLEIVVGDSALLKEGYLAGSDLKRANDINIMFKDKTIKGIFPLRGGYGAARILDLIDYSVIKRNPKVFAGYSDITILHSALNNICNLCTFHAPMACSEFYNTVDNYTKDNFMKVLFNETKGLVITNPETKSINVINHGVATGRLVGGNLTVILSSLGTKYQINTKNNILFIEEVEEAPYRIDRMILQLIQSGLLSKCSGIILGSFTNCNPSDISKSLKLEEVFDQLLKPLKIPIISNFLCGHSLPTATLPFGNLATIDTNKKFIRILE